METYTPSKIEKKWQKVWEEKKIDHAQIPDLTDKDPGSTGKPKFYALVEFPYPSGAGLHVGHVRAWSAMDAFARKKRMEGYNVLFPMGWDAFGLPAENYAIKKGVHPSITTAENIANFKRQIQSLGLSFDWSREINTTDPKYYKWTQWIFLKLMDAGLAYQKEVPVNWCPSCRTNLADEEVLGDGTHERCGKPTEKRLQKQWLLRITKYADRLIEDLKKVDFPSKVAIQQVNWIGRKEGIEITYDIDGLDEKVTVFTTRPDTNFGATFIVLSPEHPFVVGLLSSPRHPDVHDVSRHPEGLTTPKDLNSGDASGTDTLSMTKERTPQNDDKLDGVRRYVEATKKKSDEERIAEGRRKTGVFTGLYAINQLTGHKMPIWISDFVLMSFGTGAVVGVPGHDLRDFEFAKEFGLKIVRVVVGKDGDASEIKKPEQIQEEEGKMINSGFLNGLDIHEATRKIMDYMEEKGWGKRTVTYHLHDWIFSRQHYWGEPIPVVHCEKCGVVPVPEKDLPVELPYVEKYEPSGTGESPLANIIDWVSIICPKCSGPAKRETDTMPNWAGSNWYYLAYLFADKLGNSKSEAPNPKQIQNSKLENSNIVSDFDIRDSSFKNIFIENKNVLDYWMPVDVYEGGYEHTTLHLLYSRFIYKFLYDIGVVPGPEPYAARRVHGIVLGPDNRKMSKSFGNVLNPDEIVEKFGADTLRMYEMFIGPFAETVTWNMNGVAGVYRFLGRVYSLFSKRIPDLTDKDPGSGQTRRLLSKLAKKVSSDLDCLKFNTAVSAMMEFTNEITNDQLPMTNNDWDIFVRILAPMAPHLAEELYQRLHSNVIQNDSSRHPEGLTTPKDLDSSLRTAQNDGGFVSVHEQSWPDLKVEEVEQDAAIVVQINGKVREVLKMSTVKGRLSEVVEKEALNSEKVKKHLEGRAYKVIFVPGKLINFVTN